MGLPARGPGRPQVALRGAQDDRLHQREAPRAPHAPAAPHARGRAPVLRHLEGRRGVRVLARLSAEQAAEAPGLQRRADPRRQVCGVRSRGPEPGAPHAGRVVRAVPGGQGRARPAGAARRDLRAPHEPRPDPPPERVQGAGGRAGDRAGSRTGAARASEAGAHVHRAAGDVGLPEG